jgi:hypothetical protein
MSIYLNAFLMLVVTVTVFVLLARLVQTARSRGFFSSWWPGGPVRSLNAPSRLAVEQTCMIDGKRRLLLVRCDGHTILLLTGGPADMVVSVFPAPETAGVAA